MGSMNELVSKIRARGKGINRQDIAELLASVGGPGEKREDKTQAVLDLYKQVGANPNNSQGHSVIDTLMTWGEF